MNSLSTWSWMESKALPLRRGLSVADITGGKSDDDPLIIKSKNGMDLDLPVATTLLRSASDQFILDNKLDLQKIEDLIKFLEHQIDVLAPFRPDKPYSAAFCDNCLEHSNLQQEDFGSGDLVSCYVYCVENPKMVNDFLGIMYIVRAFVCNYSIDLGYNKPYQILLAQLHPLQFFGCDIFNQLFQSFAKRYQVALSIMQKV
ncbi:hypothetical protein HK100_008723 [Physocladia obscura]|uniref:Uncharacterized protein n=1 Tax=Physocladia obscura TaxID=109957 RepID=A0AAD5SN69_9FUNG|nr:hypothetical protein HK100_008723 [Physocladia obscura]